MPPQEPHDPGQHPIGTLIIVIVYGALFALGWFALYFCLFLRRGPVS